MIEGSGARTGSIPRTDGSRRPKNINILGSGSGSGSATLIITKNKIARRDIYKFAIIL
jgi:hypothetical protein